MERQREHPWWYDKKTVLTWLDIYDRNQSSWDQRIERELGSKVRMKGVLSKEDLKTMVHWKFQKLPGREKIVLRQLAKVSDAETRSAFEQSLNESNDDSRVRILDALPGIGPAMASVILTFYDPTDYGVLDIHVWRELFGPEPANLFQGRQCVLRFLVEVRKVAALHRLQARQVEKAVFQRNYDNSKSKN